MKCNVCGEETNILVKFDRKRSITSLGRILDASSQIFHCEKCSHCQTVPSIDLCEYYSNDYKTLSSSFDEDDLYAIQDGTPIYRNEHIAKTLIYKLPQYAHNRVGVLDFGCGKSLAMKHFKRLSNNEDVYLYDVSQDYIQFWDSFIPSSQYSCFVLPEEWSEKFDLVTSFFSLEHVADPLSELRKIRNVLKKTGHLYIVVPNMYSANVADMLVIDHVQHYSESSMRHLMSKSGFSLIEADHQSHAQSSIYIAVPAKHIDNATHDYNDIKSSIARCANIACFWQAVNTSIYDFETRLQDAGVNCYYIAGAGIIGTHIYVQLQHPDRVAGFIDSNQFKQEKGWQKIKVFPPGLVNGNSSTAVFSGFNMEQIETLLPVMIPDSIPRENIWTLKNAGRNYD